MAVEEASPLPDTVAAVVSPVLSARRPLLGVKLKKTASVPSMHVDVRRQLTVDEIVAGKKICRALKSYCIRRAWIRLVRYSVMKSHVEKKMSKVRHSLACKRF